MNMIEDIGAVGVDDAELYDLLLRYFHRATQISNRQIVFSRDDKGCALQLIHTKRGALSGIIRGPDLLDGDVEALRQLIADELKAPGPPVVVRAIGFSSHPTTGYFRWGDDFQILPVPPSAPRPNQLLALHPFLFEAKVAGSRQISLSIRRGYKRIRQLELLLAPLMQIGFQIQRNSGQMIWVHGSPEAGMSFSECRHEGYVYEGYSGLAEDFSLCDAYEPIPEESFQNFYTKYWIVPGKVHSIADSLAVSLTQIDLLPEQMFEKYLRAGFWYQYARASWHVSQSASYNAFVCAIEALMPAGDGERCGTCNQPVGNGPTARFRDFIDKFVPPDPENMQIRSEFYRIRSQLTHGNILLRNDLFAFDMSMRGSKETERLRSLSSLVRIAIYNWLLRQPED